MLAFLVLLSATPLERLAGQAPRVATTDTTATFRCLDTTARVRRARLDDTHAIFVEQQAVAAQPDGRILVAGNPVYVWRDRGDHWDLLARDSLFGMIVDSSPVVRAIPSPLPGRVLDEMRSVALPDGWWMVAFAEVIPAELPKHPTVLAMWVGETDGSQWRGVQRLPMITDSLEIALMPALAWRNGRARLLVPFRKDHFRRTVIYSLDDGHWTASINAFASEIAALAIALSDTQDVMAVVRPIVDAVPDKNSLHLYRKAPRDTAWLETHLVVRAGDEPVYSPVFIDGDVRLLTWQKTSHGERQFDLWFATYDEARASIARPRFVGSGAPTFAVDSHDGHMLWGLSDRRWPGPHVSLVESDGSEMVELKRQTRYRGLLGIAIAANRAVLVAAESAPNPRDPDVVSIIETHTWRCQQPGSSP